MEEQVKKGKPFYLQVSHYAMHAGRECLNKTREEYVKHPLVQAWYKKNNKDPETCRMDRKTEERLRWVPVEGERPLDDAEL